MEISDEQVEFIRADLLRRGVRLPSLQEGLLDHLCCMLEARAGEDDFDTAYRNTILEFGESEFLQVQNETQQLIHLIQKNNMSKTLRISGMLSCAFIVAGSLFKFMHWPGANIMLLLGTFIVAVIFAPVFFIYRYKTGEVSNRNTVLAIVGAAGSILLGAGGGFKFLYWPGATQLIYSGLAVLLLGYVPVYLLSVYRKSLNLTNAIATVVIIVAVSGIIFTTLGTGNSHKTNAAYYNLIKQNESYVNMQLSMNENAYKKQPDSAVAVTAKVHGEVMDYVNYIQEFKAFTLVQAGVNDYSQVESWSTTPITLLFANQDLAFNYAEANQRKKNISKQLAAGTSNLPANEMQPGMPYGLLILYLTQAQSDVLLLESKLLNK
jgi:hypothetical protein